MRNTLRSTYRKWIHALFLFFPHFYIHQVHEFQIDYILLFEFQKTFGLNRPITEQLFQQFQYHYLL